MDTTKEHLGETIFIYSVKYPRYSNTPSPKLCLLQLLILRNSTNILKIKPYFQTIMPPWFFSVTQFSIRIQLLMVTLVVSILLHPQNDRVATQLVVSMRIQGDRRLSSLRRCCALTHYDAHKMSHDAFATIRNCNTSGTQTGWWVYF